MKKSLSQLIIIILIVLLAGTLYLFYTAKKLTPVAGPQNCNSQVQPTQDNYATTDWKNWQDGEYDKTTNAFIGYELNYPRDFDVYFGDYANGNLIGKPRVKISFPKDAFLNPKTNFGEAYITVSFGNLASDLSNCDKNPDKADQTLADQQKINGVNFFKGKNIGVGAGNIYTSTVYRTIQQQRCFEIIETVHTGNIGNYDPGTVTEFDQTKATAVLDQILATFKFTDTAP